MSAAYDCYCDYEPCEVYSARVARARKAYRCEECRAEIVPGEHYERAFGISYGMTFEAFTCARCCDLRQWVKNNVPCTCWAHGNLHEDLRNSVEAAASRAPDETRGLRFGFLRRLFLITHKHGGK
jgi:hypothetical protein